VTKKSSRRDHIAFHEAGHAVVGRVLTLPCKGASIVANHRSYGRSVVVHYEICEEEWAERGKRRGTARNRQRAALDAAIMTAMAGVEAEVEFFVASLDGSGDADMAQIEEWSFDEPVDRHKREVRLRAMTRVLVRRHRKRIERVAEALLAKEHLTAKQVDKLAGRSVDDVEPNIPGWEVPI
jgi:ATP-dependent Zn protease